MQHSPFLHSYCFSVSDFFDLPSGPSFWEIQSLFLDPIPPFGLVFATLAKVTKVKHFIAVHNLHLFGGCKSNLNHWCNLQNTQLKEWFWLADSCCTFLAHNLHKSVGHFWFSGTFWITAGHTLVHIASGTQDLSNLDQWVSCSLLGWSGKNYISFLPSLHHFFILH